MGVGHEVGKTVLDILGAEEINEYIQYPVKYWTGSTTRSRW